MKLRDEIRKGCFYQKESHTDPDGNTWYYRVNPTNNTAILCPEEIKFVKSYGSSQPRVKPAVSPVPKEKLKIPETINNHRIVGIEEYSFYNSADAKKWFIYNEVIFHEGIKYIGDSSFEECDALEKISGVFAPELIGPYAFAKCKKLRNVLFSPGVKEIEVFAFNECSSLERVWFCEGIVMINIEAFAKCRRLIQIDLPDSINFVGKSAFDGSDCQITYPEKLGFDFAPSVRWRMRTNNALKRGLFNLIHRESLFSRSRYQ